MFTYMTLAACIATATTVRTMSLHVYTMPIAGVVSFGANTPTLLADMPFLAVVSTRSAMFGRKA
ncbi:MAG: hypothetical protein AAGJ35_07420 [Myxococcota bacterium]